MTTTRPHARQAIAKTGRLQVGIILLALTTVLALSSGSGAGAEEWRWYSYKSGCNRSDHLDPVGMVFLGKHADDSYVDQEVQDRMSQTYGGDWNHGDPGGQFLVTKDGSPSPCNEMTQSIASNAGYPRSRWHMRVGTVIRQYLGTVDPSQPPGFNPSDLDPGPYMYWSLGTPHYDQAYLDLGPGWHPPDAGHCNPPNSPNGSGFDRARRHFKQGIRDGGPKSFIEIRGTSEGNTRIRKDGCGGKVVSSNGMVVWVRMGAIPQQSVASTGPYTP
jgi:hypothetical protein